ncbi:MAG: glycosyltransferase family 4 protein [Candidatus Latescibacterota bacterium]
MNNNEQSTNGTKKLLVISPWESVWSLDGKAGVSDDYHFIEKFAKRNYELHFLIPKGEANDQFALDNLFTHTYFNFFRSTQWLPKPLRRLLIPLLFNLIVMPSALRIARRLRPDFVLGHTHYSSMVTFALCKLQSIPCGVKLFGVMDLVHTEWPRWRYLFKNFEQIIALKFPQDLWIVLDDGTQGDEILHRQGIDKSKIHFLPNGINLEWADLSCDRESARRQLGIPMRSHVVLFLARFVPSKRPQSLLRAIPHVLRSVHEDTRFLFAGDGPTRDDCESLARRLGIAQQTLFIGSVPHKKVPDIFHASDLFVTTSNLTNMAIPTCEAFLCGVPAVAFDVGATKKVVINGATGRTVRDGDVAALAGAITDILNDEEQRKEMGRRAKQFALDHFTSWDERTDRELEIINRWTDRSR